jgi:hemerythrin
MALAWTDRLAVGDEMIDADHRRMIDLIALLEAAAQQAAADIAVDCAQVGEILSDLVQLCIDHFKREEDLQRRIGYPDVEAHCLCHQMLVKRLDSVLSHYGAGCAEVRTGIIKTLGDSLATWLVTHITTNDMDLKGYI